MTAPQAQTPPNSRFWYAAPHFVAFVSFIPALYLSMFVGFMVGLPLWGHLATSALILSAPITSAALILKAQGRPVGWKRKTLRPYLYTTVFAIVVVVVTLLVGEAVLPLPGELPEDFDSYLLGRVFSSFLLPMGELSEGVVLARTYLMDVAALCDRRLPTRMLVYSTNWLTS